MYPMPAKPTIPQPWEQVQPFGGGGGTLEEETRRCIRMLIESAPGIYRLKSKVQQTQNVPVKAHLGFRHVTEFSDIVMINENALRQASLSRCWPVGAQKGVCEPFEEFHRGDVDHGIMSCLSFWGIRPTCGHSPTSLVNT